MNVDKRPIEFAYVVEMTEDEWRRLYVDVQRALEHLGVDYAGNRKNVDIPALYALYDALYSAGADRVSPT